MPRTARPGQGGKAAFTVDLAREIGVRYLLDGSVRLADGRVRVSAQLFDADAGGLLWADRFDRALIDIFAIQDEITMAIVRHLEIELLPEEWQAIHQSRTESVEAYTYYRHGRQLARQLTKSHLLMARRILVKAVELDPEFARAHAAIVLCDCYLMEWHATSETPAAILEMAEKALRLDPRLAEAYVARGFALYRSGRHDDAQAAYDRAVAIDDGCYEARLFAGFLAWSKGDRESAKALFILAANLRPDDYLAPTFIIGMFEKGDPELLAWARICVERAERDAMLNPENPALLSRGAVALAHLGEVEKARSWLMRAQTIDPEDLVTCYNAAAVHSLLGDQDEAIRLLERYLRYAADDMLDVIRHDGDMAGLKHHERYESLLGDRR